MSVKLPKLFLDSSDPQDTLKVKSLIGGIDGQTTNPSLVVKNKTVKSFIDKGKKITEKELIAIYKDIINELDSIISGPISVETYADWETTSEEMLQQAHEMKTWGKNIYVKFPAIPAGIEAAYKFTAQGGKVNLTLVFDQIQGAGVFVATMATKTPAFISPFVGRWDDRGYNGLDLVKNLKKMYKSFNHKLNRSTSHIQILGASVRSLDHFYSLMVLDADIITAPLSIYEEWMLNEKFVPDESYKSSQTGLKNLIYSDISFYPDYKSYDILKVENSLLDEGLQKFVKDWKSAIT